MYFEYKPQNIFSMRHKIDTPKYLTLSKFQTPKYLPTFPIKNYGDYHTLGLWYLIAYFTNTIHSRRSMEEVHWDKNPSVLGYFHLLRYELPWYLWKSIQQTLPKILVLHKFPPRLGANNCDFHSKNHLVLKINLSCCTLTLVLALAFQW